MATIQKRRNAGGSISYVARVRIRPFKPTARAFAKRKDAAAWADALEAELRAQRGHGAARENLGRLTIADLIGEFRTDPDNQRLRYFDSLEPLLAWWLSHYGAERVARLNVLKLRHARQRLRPGRRPATVNRYLAAMRSCWNWGRAVGLVAQDHPWPSRLMLTEHNERQRYLSDEELRALVAAAHTHSRAMHAAVVVSIACGLRQGELLRLTWSDVDLDGQRLQVVRSGSEPPRFVHLPAAAAAALKRLRGRAAVAARPVFTTETGDPMDKSRLRYRWLEVRAAAGLRDFRWHDLRHSCAAFLAQRGASLGEIAAVLGHSSPSLARRYGRLVAGAPVTARAALDSKPGRRR